MLRRDFVQRVGAFGLLASAASAGGATAATVTAPQAAAEPPPAAPLTAPPGGTIPVAFLVSEGAVVIDFCGPWEVFQDVAMPGGADSAFALYTVAETTAPVRVSGGLRIVPDYSLQTAPAPKVLVIPAQSGASEPLLEWIRQASRTTDVTMSVCNGAFLLASTGLLTGRAATAHHAAYGALAMAFPDVRVQRGVRFVEDGRFASAGGLSSGIDLALHVVERYFGREVARRTAYGMEYQGLGWLHPESNAVYAAAPVSVGPQHLCPVCLMDVDPASAPRSDYQSKTYYFCTPAHRQRFDATPARFVERLENAVTHG